MQRSGSLQSWNYPRHDSFNEGRDVMLILTLLKERVWSFSYFIFQINVEYHHTPAPAGQRATASPLRRQHKGKKY